VQKRAKRFSKEMCKCREKEMEITTDSSTRVISTAYVTLKMSKADLEDLHMYLNSQPKKRRCGITQIGQEQADQLEKALLVRMQEINKAEARK
jgi:hypothetical protein